MFCLKNFLGGFLISWFDDNVSLLAMLRVKYFNTFFSLNSFLFLVKKK